MAGMARPVVKLLLATGAAFAMLGGTALAGEWSGEVVINGGGHYTRSGQSWYQVLACPIATTFDVAASVADDWGTAGGLGNASNSIEPCIVNWTGTGPLSSSFTVYNLDSSNTRTFWIYAYY